MTSAKIGVLLKGADRARLEARIQKAARVLRVVKGPEPSAPSPATHKVADYQGIPIVIDRPAGYIQRGVDAGGEAWERVYHVDYGYIEGTQGGDGEGMDVFLGRHSTAKEAHWIQQKKADGSFDEYKIVLGAGCVETAKGLYLAHIPKRFFGGIATTSLGMVKALRGLPPGEVMKALNGHTVVQEMLHDAYDCTARVEKKVKHESDGWHVYSMDGEKHLGGPYDTKAKAVERLRQVEGHKEKSLTNEEMMRKRWDGTRLLPVGKEGEATELRYVLGIVLMPDRVDAQGDVYSADEIRKAEWDYMINMRNVGFMHKHLVNGKVQLVESFIAPVDMTVEGSAIPAGTWLMGLHVPDDAIWEQVKSGAIGGLSIGGLAAKQPV